MTTAEREQCMDALTIANNVRCHNARLRLEIAALDYHDGCLKVAAHLEQPAGPVLSFPIGRLLTSITKVGEEGMARFLKHAGIFSPTKRVRSLTPRQRRALAEVLRNRTLIYPGSGLW